MSYKLNGKVKVIFDEQTFASGFNKREFVVTVENGKFPQDVKLEALKDKVELVNALKVGDHVDVQFDINGREFNGKYFVNLAAWKITADRDMADNALAGGHVAEAIDEEPPF